MIVISGALVLVALVLLIVGVVGPDLTFVYASIAVSLVSLVFLVIGILQRRGETAPAADAGAAEQTAPAQEDDSVTAVIPAQSVRVPQADAPVAETVDEELETGGTVLIVEGRPRYHVEGCRYLSSKTSEKIDVLDAREEGFSPCGVCKPDDALAARADEAELDEPAYEEELVVEEPAEPVVEEDVPGVGVAPARKAPARKAAKAPAKKAPAKKAASTRTVAPAKTASATRAAAGATAATPAAAAAKKTGSVVVIPDRGKFHRAECRYVRDVAGAEAMSKTAASRQGYAACGVCKP